jgi:sulfite exporter TauE/SafE
MMALLLTALVMGALGSMHCVAMCGALALSLPSVSSHLMSKLVGGLLYNLGRVTTYAIIGALLGLMGASFAWVGLQQAFSIIVGVSMLLYLFWPAALSFKKNNGASQSFFVTIREMLGKLFFKKHYGSIYLIGLLNGLLPCGLVYMALAGAVTMGSVVNSSLFMAAFGLGTLPVMWAVAFLGGFALVKARVFIKKAYPYMVFVMACLLIIRGLNMNIPYLSPHFETGTHQPISAIKCHPNR